MPVERYIQPVLLCGGSGTRLWPLSRDDFPKQFLKLFGTRSLFQETVLRAGNLEPHASPLIVGSRKHRSLLEHDLTELGAAATVLLEPAARNTAPALADAALMAARRNPQSVLAVMPSDHHIADSAAMVASIRNAVEAAANGALVIFGIKPAYANTGYGYIQKGAPSSFPSLSQVSKFIEKPDSDTAERLVRAGDYLWNAGIFLLRADRCLELFERYAPDVLECAREAVSMLHVERGFQTLPGSPYERCRSVSIDNAVMEHCTGGLVAEIDVGWTDVGTWSSVWEVDSEGGTRNVTAGNVLLDGVTRSLIHSHSRLVVASGISDQIVIETADAVLVAPRSHSQRVRELAATLKQRGRTQLRSGQDARGTVLKQELLVDRPDLQIGLLHLAASQCIVVPAEGGYSERWLVLKGNAEVSADLPATGKSPDEQPEPANHVNWRIRNLGESPADVLWISLREAEHLKAAPVKEITEDACYVTR